MGGLYLQKELLTHVKFLSEGVGEFKLERKPDRFIISFKRHYVIVTITYDMSLELDIQQSVSEYNVI